MRTLAVIFLLIYFVDYSIGDRITDDAVIVEGEFLTYFRYFRNSSIDKESVTNCRQCRVLRRYEKKPARLQIEIFLLLSTVSRRHSII